ncbi:MAG: hypothetical protein PHG40_05715 [Candidatus Omnitrophica bacterium]|nr:hypothetical protein [Candidatus Omnitrophota bacterium]
MLKRNTARKGVILLIVLATLLVVIILAGVILSIVTNQTRLTTHQVGRIKAYYAGKGMMNYTLDMLRKGTWAAHATDKRYACHGDCTALGVPSPTYTIPADTDIPYNILVTIYPLNQLDINNIAYPLLNGKVTQLNVKVDYSYTPG